jgi:hypothetical protein
MGEGALKSRKSDASSGGASFFLIYISEDGALLNAHEHFRAFHFIQSSEI